MKDYIVHKMIMALHILTCINQNDRFTVNDTTNDNGALTYPVGLIVADEVMMAGVGAVAIENYSYYLYTGNFYWTMTPSGFSEGGPPDFDGDVLLHAVTYYGGLGTAAFTYDNLGVRPVLSLKSDVQLQGNGTMDSPFEVVS